jgi:hypothetical protein
MDSLLFCVMHHSTCSFHTEVFDMCISSIKKHYPKNKILVCYTSTSVIPDHMKKYTNVVYQSTPMDGAHIYSAMSMLIQIDSDMTKVENYILLHDSMILLKPLPNDILDKRFYYLWHFDALYYQFSDKVIHLICNTKFTYAEQCELLEKYNNEAGITWSGMFGPAFGGKISILKELWGKLNIDHDKLKNYVGKEYIMMAERYLAVIASYMKIVDTFPNTMALNGSIEDNPYRFCKPYNMHDVNIILSEKYDAYMTKIWLMRP